MAAFADTDILGSTIREEKTDMRKKSIFRQMLIPMIAVIGLLAAIIITIFIAAYEKDIYARNTYLEQIYIQGTDGIQTGRSQGELADRSTRWWFIQMMSEKSRLYPNPTILSRRECLAPLFISLCIGKKNW